MLKEEQEEQIAGHRIYRGILKRSAGKTFILTDNGQRCLESEPIWDGYLAHWQDKRVCARFLPQHDYETGAPIVLVWPEKAQPAHPHFELFYNERLVMHPLSICGHNAINVNGEVFNFSHLVNENEAISLEEYLYRPALGEFAPAPGKKRTKLDDKKEPYFDKFGRLFMRTVHVIRVEGLATGILSNFFHDKMRQVHAAPVNPKRPASSARFHFLKETCTTIIRDGLRRTGFAAVKGVTPRDLFISAAFNFSREQERGLLKVTFYTMPQLEVKEAPGSAATPPLNPGNWLRLKKLRKIWNESSGERRTGRVPKNVQ